MYGLTTTDGKRTELARKRTGFMTNSPCFAEQLNKKCPNTNEWKLHEHMVLINGRPNMAQVYPDKLCRAICEGFKEQLEHDRKGQLLIADYDLDESRTSRELLNMSKQLKEFYYTVEENNDKEVETAWDDVSGAELKPELVKKARQEEMQYVRKMRLYDKVPVE